MADLYERLKRFKKHTTQSVNTVPDAETPSSPSPLPAPLPKSLNHIPGITRARDLVGIAEKRDREKLRFLETLGVNEAENGHGKYGTRDVFYPLEQLKYPPEDITGSELALQTRDESLAPIGAKDILFFDTETTGLAGGTGTVPFLTGVGFFEKDGFLVRQFLMRDYDEEPAVLHEILQLLERFPSIASYNGKCFDAPILQSRFLLNRFRSNIQEMPHADFLFSARRLWREMLPDCRLLTVEKYLTGQTREDDIPGEQIPYVYFDFLRGLRIQRMRPVLHHNAEDILTLALIASRACRMLRLPPPDDLRGLEYAAVGRCYAAMSDWERSCWYFERAAGHQDIPEANRLTVHKQLSVFYKRQMRFEDARALWETMTLVFADPFAFIELAKFFEHKEKEYTKALEFTEKALEFVPHDSGNSAETLRGQLLHRRGRLLRKTGRE